MSRRRVPTSFPQWPSHSLWGFLFKKANHFKMTTLNIRSDLIENKSDGAEEFLAQVTYGFRNIKDTFQNQKVYLIMLSLKDILQV